MEKHSKKTEWEGLLKQIIEGNNHRGRPKMEHILKLLKD